MFMWIEYTDLPSSHNTYRRKGTYEELGTTHCPKCSCEMIVPKGSFRGININSENVELIGAIRGL